MYQQAMKQALGKLITVASEAAGISRFRIASGRALTRIRPGALAAFQRYLDAKRVGGWRWRQAHDVEDSYGTCLTRRAS